MILAMLMLYPNLIDRGVLLHSMLPLAPESGDFKGKEFCVSFGANDQMIPAKESRKVVAYLKRNGARVRTVSHEGGHEIWLKEVRALEHFFELKRA